MDFIFRYHLVIFLLIFLTPKVLVAVVTDENFMKQNIKSLSEVPLERLLQIKRAMDELRQVSYTVDEDVADKIHDQRMVREQNFDESNLKKSAMALIDEQKIMRKTTYGAMMENPWETKPTKIQTFFQVSVTALAFLAFAGYLLCMIVQAIKNKQTMYMYPNSMALTNSNGANTLNSIVNSGSIPLRKRRPIGRRKRNVFLSADNRNHTDLFTDQSFAFSSPDPAEIYNVMIQCAEDYTKLYYI